MVLRDRVPVTRPARTLLDLADVLDDRHLARAVNEARVLRLVTVEHIDRMLARSPGRRGAARLRAYVMRGGGPTRSQLEDAFLAFVDRHRLPRPEVNARVAGYEVDAVWRSERVAVELDGRAYHAHEQAFERDRRKAADLAAAGWRVVPVTWAPLRDDPGDEARRLAAALS
ncbi:MAG TPA: DUF559 domain-containing protein [Solirubrobacteraceae bacterium]|nr:DUF559 domain-containing protein [Solirubrobacteraceae bacterium]